jgi:hypothetical protein
MKKPNADHRVTVYSLERKAVGGLCLKLIFACIREGDQVHVLLSCIGAKDAESQILGQYTEEWMDVQRQLDFAQKDPAHHLHLQFSRLCVALKIRFDRLELLFCREQP